MVGPVGERRRLARQRRQPAGHEIAEGLAAGVQIAAAAIDEIHRHVENVVDPALEAEAVLEREGQHAGAVRVGIGPDMGAPAFEAVRLALGEGRVGEQRRRDRLERQADAELLRHVGFGGIVEIDLHRAGPGHHVEAEIALLRHVIAHDAVAALGHPGHVLAPPFRIEAEADQAGAQLPGYLFGFGQVGVDLVAGPVNGFQRRAGQFELPARLQADGRAAARSGR